MLSPRWKTRAMRISGLGCIQPLGLALALFLRNSAATTRAAYRTHEVQAKSVVEKEIAMWGFKMSAWGSNGFKQKSSAWTEGSMTSLKFALSLPKLNPSSSGGGNRGMIRSVEASFGKIRAALLSQACGSGMNFGLVVTRNIKLKYYFDGSKSPEQTQSEFLHALAVAKGHIGDQVMIHLCRMINDFVMANLSKSSPYFLTIDVDL